MTTERPQPDRPQPDYWVVRHTCDDGSYLYLSKSGPWDSRARALPFNTYQAARNGARCERCRVIAVRRKPSVKSRIADLVARCKAAIDEEKARGWGEYVLPLGDHSRGLDRSDVAKVLSAIDPAAAAEIRKYWEAK